MITKEIPYHKHYSPAICGLTTIQKLSPLDYAYKECPEKLALLDEHPQFRELLEGCFKIDYNDRMTIENIIDSPIMGGSACKCSVKCQFA